MPYSGDATYEQFIESKKNIESFTKKSFGIFLFIGLMFSTLILCVSIPEGGHVDIGNWIYLISLLPILICMGVFIVFNAEAIRAFLNEDYHIYHNNVEKYEDSE